MFEIFSALIVQALSKIFGASVDKITKDASSKRSMASSCIELFDSLYNLENTSKDVFTIFKQIADGKRTATNIMIKEKMENLFRSYETFVKNLRIVESKFAIYNQDLLYKIKQNVIVPKFGTFKIIDVLLDISPVQLVEGSKLTPFITYLEAIPKVDLSNRLTKVDLPNPLNGIEQHSNKEIELLKKSVLSKFKKKTVNLSLRKEAEIALKSAEENIKDIQKTREQLGEFIKENFPLKEILL